MTCETRRIPQARFEEGQRDNAKENRTEEIGKEMRYEIGNQIISELPSCDQPGKIFLPPFSSLSLC